MNCVYFQAQGVWSVDYIPRGTRFGPLNGEITKEEPLRRGDTNRICLWKVCVKS